MKVKVKVIPVIINATETVLKRFRKKTGKIEEDRSRLYRPQQCYSEDSWRLMDCCHSASIEKPSANVGDPTQLQP